MKSWILTITHKIAVAALVLALAGTFMFAAGSAYASPYGIEITKYDGVGYSGSGAAGEDNETEPNMVLSQAWDLEGFFLDGKKLTIVGGYNFYTGQEGMDAGDIFIDTNGDAVYSPNEITGFDYAPGYKTVSNGLFKYDYVLDINWADGTYNIVELNMDSILRDTEYGALHNKPSNPWIYVSGGTVKTGGSFTTSLKGDTGFSGMGTNNNHYVATFDISAIDLSNGAVFHNTMECGNDNLIGKAAPVPEPSTLVLICAGLLGVGLARRRIRK